MTHSNDPLHGITLETIIIRLVAYFGWEKLGSHIRINCFNFEPSIKSSLKFLRKTAWARKKVEDLYLDLDYSKKEKKWWKLCSLHCFPIKLGLNIYQQKVGKNFVMPVNAWII